MTQSNHLSQLRFGLCELWKSQAPERPLTTPGLHFLLALPIAPRLLLLATLDGASERQIRRSLQVCDRQTPVSEQVAAIRSRLKSHLVAPYDHWPQAWTREDVTPEADVTQGQDEVMGTSYWAERHGPALETQLSKLLWADVAVCLFGASVPSQIAGLSLQQRMILYLLLVEHSSWQEVMSLTGCSEHAIRRTIKDGLRAVGGQ